MMQCGFAVLESSFVRKRNSVNIMMKNLCDLCMGSIAWYACGWAIAYGYTFSSDTDSNPS
jgi:Amt family ammonium transporter